MQYFTWSTLLLGLLLISCTETGTPTGAAKKPASAQTDDKADLEKLVRQLYTWHETKSSMDDFDPIADADNSAYIGIDQNKHAQRLAELKETGFFATQFLENYQAIASKIDKDLKSKKMEWLVGDMPPFGNDANPWCNCQDNPENYWQTLTIDHVVTDGKTATFNWTWGDNFEYNVRAVQENGAWKIAYLQGFDLQGFFPE